MTLKFVGGHDEPDRDGRLPAVSAPVNGVVLTVQPVVELFGPNEMGRPQHWDDLSEEVKAEALAELAAWSQNPTAEA